MAEYLPITKPGQAETGKASGAIVGRQLVAVSGSGTIAAAGAGSTAVVGVAAFDGAVNDNVTYYSGGTQEPVATGAITAGSPVVAGANGTVVASAAPPAGQQVGVAKNTAADGARVRVAWTR